MQAFVCSSAWCLLSDILLPKTNISSTVIIQYMLHLISRGSEAGPKQPCQLSKLLEEQQQLVNSFQTTV